MSCAVALVCFMRLLLGSGLNVIYGFRVTGFGFDVCPVAWTFWVSLTLGLGFVAAVWEGLCMVLLHSTSEAWCFVVLVCWLCGLIC